MRLLRSALCSAAVVVAVLLAGLARAEAAPINACAFATSNGTHNICWLDFTNISGITSDTISIVLPDGSTLTGNLTNPQSVVADATPDYSTQVAFGGTGNFYDGLTGKPTLYTLSHVASSFVLSNLAVTDPLGNVLNAVAVAGADSESLDTGDNANGNTGYLKWTTSATTLSQLQLMVPAGGTGACALTTTAMQITCVPNTETFPANAYIFASPLTAASQSFGMSLYSPGGGQGIALGIRMAQLTVAKTVASRITGDAFTVNISRPTSSTNPAPNGAAIKTASTTATGTTANTGALDVVPNYNYSVNETTTAGSSPISEYASTLTCTNATAGSTTTLPNDVAEQAAIIDLAADDAVTCTFTNNDLTMASAATNSTYPMNTPETDTFTLKNTSAIAGTFTVQTPTITAASGATIAPTGYTFGGNTYASITALDTAIKAAGTTAANATITVGVTYTTSSDGSANDKVSLPATIGSGTGTSATTTGLETDTLTPQASLGIVKSGTTQTSPGGLIAYSILVTNNGPNAATGAIFSDTMPAGVTIATTAAGAPTCTTTSGGAVCGTVTLSTTTPQTVSSTIGTFPSGSSLTFTIDATAAKTCANTSSPCVYTNTASVSDPSGTSGATQTSSLSTTVAQTNGLSKTVQDVTQGTAATNASNVGKPGDVLQYVLTFTNTTGQPIYGLTVSDPLASTLTYYTGNISVSCVVNQSSGNAPTCTPAYAPATTTKTTTTPPTITGSLSSGTGANPLAPGASVTVTFQVKIN